VVGGEDDVVAVAAAAEWDAAGAGENETVVSKETDGGLQ
jgi:hypothetical protein